MSYPRGADVGVAGSGGGSIGSASLVATLGTYVTSNSLSIALLNYPSSNSVSAMIVTGVGDRPTSNSVSAMIVTGIGDRPTSNSVSTQIVSALSTYITSNSVSIALATYVTSNSFSAFRASLTLDTLVNVTISATLSTGQVLKWDGTKWTNDTDLTGGGGASVGSASLVTILGGYVTSNSMSARLLTFVTSSSLLTALGTYLTSASAALSTYITSGSLTTALTPYLTSSSANLATYLTSNSFSAWAASLTLDRLVDVSLSAVSDGQVLKWNAAASQWLNSADLTGGGGGSDTFTACVVAATSIMTVQGKNVGLVLLGSISFNARNGNTSPIAFSGSWSDIAIFELMVNFGSLAASNTASVAIYTDGGTTPIMSLNVGTISGAQNYVVARIFNGTAHKSINIQGTVVGTTVKNGITNTANTGVLNCVKLILGALTPTMSAGQAYLYGWRGRL
jgi:hypothetical protein